MSSDALPTSPRLIVFAGLPGAGKPAIARLVAERRRAAWLRVDSIDADLLKGGLPHSFDTGHAAYLAAQAIARDRLRSGRHVAVDAVNVVEEGRQLWRDLAKSPRATLQAVEAVCSDGPEHRRRVEVRDSGTPPPPMPPGGEVDLREYQPWYESGFVVDSMTAAEMNVDRILTHYS